MDADLTLLILFSVSLAFAIGFHWLAMHRETSSAKELRELIRGDPAVNAVIMYLFAAVSLIMLSLRACDVAP